jgi:Fe-S-cluster containining protein
MQFVPWQRIADWHCNLCGLCCRAYSVVLNFHEWLRIIKEHGVEQTFSGVDRLYVKRRSDGSCTFLHNFAGNYVCGLQSMKPKACKIWPFKISAKPQHGYANEAVYHYGENTFFVYADHNCTGLRLGYPTLEFATVTLKEFLEIALGARVNQFKTTANLNFATDFLRF